MTNTRLTRPQFSKLDPFAVRLAQKAKTTPIPKMEKKSSVLKISYIVLATSLTVMVLLWMMLIMVWPVHSYMVIQTEKDKQINCILRSTTEADSWHNYVRGLIFDMHNKQGQWTEEPKPDCND